jgi:hypothetical protein
MPCTTRPNLVEVAVRTLIKEIIATYEARRRERRLPDKCPPCQEREAGVPP